jgi:nitroreductase
VNYEKEFPEGANMKPPKGTFYPFGGFFLFLFRKLIVFRKLTMSLGSQERGGFMSKEMNRREFMKVSAATGAVLMTGGLSPAFAQELKPIQLLAPQLDGGRPRMQVLKDRRSTRWYSAKKIPLQILSNLLWAAVGINRPHVGLRTAPQRLSSGGIDIYVATADGVFFYEAKENALNPVVAEDVRNLSGQQYPPSGMYGGPVGEAPVNLIYVWDGLKNSRYSDELNLCLAFSLTGFISQNAYLYCASEGLMTVVRHWFAKPALEKKMKLRPEQYATLVQSVGYP